MKQKRWKTDGYLRIFASYYRPHWKLFALDMVCALCICLVDLAFPIVSRFSMQTLLPGQMFTAFFVVMAVLAGAYVLKGCFYYIITYWGHLLGVRMEADIRRDLFSHMQDLSFSFYDKNRTGQLMSRVTGDLFEITELAHHGPEDLFISSITILGAFCVMLTIRWELALIVFAVIPLFILFTTLCRKRMMRASTEVKAKLAGINGEVESSISGMRTAKAFANEAAESAKFDQANDQFRGAKRGYYRAMAFYQSGMEFFMGILSVVVIAFGGFLLMRGRMDLIDLTTFFLYISTFITPIRKLSAFVEQFMQGMAGFKRFVALMRVEPDIQDEPDAQELTDVKGDIRVEDVTFRYEPSDSAGAGARHPPRPARRDCGGGGPLRRRQVHPVPAHPPVLRCHRGPGAGGRKGRAHPHPALSAGRYSGSSSRMSFSLPAPSTTTSATAGLTPPRPRSWRPPSGRRSTTTSWTCPTASRPRWASGAPCSPAARSSVCPLPAFS